MGVALTSCIVPAAGSPTFVLEEDESETGAGIHGEPGRRRLKLKTADAIAEEMLAVILGDLASARGAICLLLVNGFGGTSAMEFYLMVNAIRRILAHRVQAARYPVGSYVTSLDGGGKWAAAKTQFARQNPVRGGILGPVAYLGRLGGKTDRRLSLR
jgi:dihydroxyacetone kinase-like protein